MQALTPVDTPSFLQQFDYFGDAIVKSVCHVLVAPGMNHTTIVISALDTYAFVGADNDGWVNVRLVITGVSDFQFKEVNSSCQVLSMGITVLWVHGKVACDFTMHDETAINLDGFANSEFFIIGTDISWDVAPYAEVLI